jgi:putative transposase
MAEERLALAELLEKAGEGDFLRSVAEAVLQLLMETDIEGLIGAGRYERNGERTTWRNGFRERSLDTRLGSLQLRIPKLRQGSYFPPFLEARKGSEKALVAVIQEAWIGGVSTRRVDDLVQAMGLSGISKSQVSRLCKDIDERVHGFLERPLTGECECRLNTPQPARLGAPPVTGETVGLIVDRWRGAAVTFLVVQTPFPNMARGLLRACEW